MRIDHNPSSGSGEEKVCQDAVQKHFAPLAGSSVDGVTATKLRVLEATMRAATKDVLMVDGHSGVYG